MSTSGLACEQVTVAPGATVVLRKVQLHVPAGTLTVLVGPSGVGKTTLVRAVAGLESLVDGRVRLAGRDLAGVPVHRRRVAMVFQHPRLFPNLDVADNVAFALRARGVARTRRRARAQALLDEVGLAGTDQRAVSGLSGGEQQRVALARALSTTPDLLVLDEPLAAVDPNRRETLRGLIRQLQVERGLTCLYVTHDRTEAAELGDRIALMLEGRVVQHGPPQELFDRPHAPAVARFLGSPNLLSGSVVSGTLAVAGVAVPVPGADGGAAFTIRPERIHLHDPAAVPRPQPLARVEASTYLGDACRVGLTLDGATLEAQAPVPTAPRVGTTVAVELPKADLWRFPEPRPASSGETATGDVVGAGR